MRYSQKIQEKVIKESLTKSTLEISQEYNIPEHIIKKWLFLDMPEEQMKVRVRQKFYSLIPCVESQITGYLSNRDFIVYGITDEEWEDFSKFINKTIFNTMFTVYKAAQLEKVCKKGDVNEKGELVSETKKEKKYKDSDKQIMLFDDLNKD